MLRNLSIVIFFLLVKNANSQQDDVFNTKFTYKLVYQTDSTDVFSKKSENMFLFVNRKKSIFQSENRYLLDSILNNLNNNPKKTFTSINASNYPKTKINYKIVKYKSNDTIDIFDKIFTNTYKYQQEKNKMKWKIKSDTITIHGLKCQKATTSYAGRNYQAWFSNQIPISDGPYKFQGLPGLIVKVHDDKGHYVFTLINKSVVDLNYRINSRNYIQISKKEYFKKLEDFNKNIFQKMAISGFTVDDKFKQKLKKKLKKRNNPIELKID